MSEITSGNLRLISQELLDALDDTFRAPEIHANTSVEHIKWEAAQRAVVDWIKHKAGKHQQVGVSNKEPGRPPQTGAIVRYGK